MFMFVTTRTDAPRKDSSNELYQKLSNDKKKTAIGDGRCGQMTMMALRFQPLQIQPSLDESGSIAESTEALRQPMNVQGQDKPEQMIRKTGQKINWENRHIAEVRRV